MTVGSRARTMMRMRADIERDTATGTDDWGHDVAPTWSSHITGLACWVHSRQRREAVDTEKIALVEDLRMMFDKDADVTAEDRIAQITDRRGTVLYSGKIRIKAIQYKHDHAEAMLERDSAT